MQQVMDPTHNNLIIVLVYILQKSLKENDKNVDRLKVILRLDMSCF